MELDKARRDEKASRIKAIEIAQNATIPHYTDFIVDCRADPFREIERFITECDIWVVNDVDKIFFVQLNFRDEVSEGKVEMITEANMKREVNIYFDQFTLLIDDESGKNISSFKKPYIRFWEALKQQFHQLKKREYRDRSFFSNEVLNNMWLKPKFDYTSPPHPFFDVLLKCLSGGDMELKMHLEMCILRKRFFPDDITIPTIIWQDPGGTGKQLFIKRLLHTIFSGLVRTGGPEFLFGAHRSNIGILGKAIVWADDVTLTDTQVDMALRTIGNTPIEARGMGKDPVEIHNSAWYFLSNNNSDPLVKVNLGGRDRRFTYVRLGYDGFEAQNVEYWIEQDGLSPNGKRYLDDNLHVLTDREKVAAWLGELLLRYGMPFKRIDGYRDQGWTDLVIRVREGTTNTLDMLFMTTGLNEIRTHDLVNFGPSLRLVG